ncbi:unnamed protein product [Ceratitis capitata]|uniref:(Mediterranean fruit fly) hypothetical protein n=1 Tax=Ceratitis capitata TaxID=7213 RepID=A0A811UR66_CERCA|nr:unnamed protein product [Ceratitis capitata]CAD7001202.1 unnamed protein product [Ceratitis capitata]CAD7001203.1 unnamed protein product [Ceratitis capitata]CAD7001211.1 unnamed protein product [Ceratitis capitata]
MRTNMDLELPQQSLNADTLNAHEHLKSLPILPYTDCKARLLIGLDNTTELCVSAEVHQVKDRDLTAASFLNISKNKRIVLVDAAAKVNDTSLNDVLLKGPDLLQSPVGRFRERRICR